MKKIALCAMILAGASTAANAQAEAGVLAGLGTGGVIAGVSFLAFIGLALTNNTTSATTTTP